MELGESREDYLETIYMLTLKGDRGVKSSRIAEEMQLSKPSVSHAVKCLEEIGYLKKQSTGEILLTEKGKKLGKMIYERHLFFKAFLMKIGVPEKRAGEEACRIEHVLSEESYALFKEYVENKG